jgi:hypothetical protein
VRGTPILEKAADEGRAEHEMEAEAADQEEDREAVERLLSVV